ncbi:glycosyltransferase [Natronoarchaeum mannanilyticum]
MTDASVIWFTPDKPEDISVGRRMIARHLRDEGFDVDLHGTTPGTVARCARSADSYDVLVGTTRAGAFAATVLAKVHGLPLVVDHVDPIRQFETTHPRWLSTPVRAAENASFRLADHLLYVYDEERERVERRADATKTALGLEYDRFASPEPDAVERARKELDARGVDGPVAIYVGGLEPIYGIETLLDAVARLEEWTLVVLGTGSLDEAVERADRRRDDVEHLGVVPHEAVPGYLRVADVGVSLVDDPHTLKVLEYAAAGIAVVQAAGRAEARFGDAVTYCQTTPEAVAAAIERADERGPSHEFREFVRQFDWARIAETYASVLRRVAGTPERTAPHGTAD